MLLFFTIRLIFFIFIIIFLFLFLFISFFKYIWGGGGICVYMLKLKYKPLNIQSFCEPNVWNGRESLSDGVSRMPWPCLKWTSLVNILFYMMRQSFKHVVTVTTTFQSNVNRVWPMKSRSTTGRERLSSVNCLVTTCTYTFVT